MQGSILPQGLDALPIPLLGDDVQSLARVIDKEDGGSHGLQCRNEDHTAHVFLGTGGSQSFGGSLQLFAE